MKNSKKSWIPGYIGLACVWFGIHCGPGTASGKQAAVYFLSYGKWALIFPFLAMTLLGTCIYYSIEFSRVAKVANFKDFANKLFHPYEKYFATYFEITFVGTVGLSGGACMYTGAHLFFLYYGLPVWIGLLIISAFTLFFSIYGAELVRVSNSYMAFIIFLAMIVLVVTSLALIGGPGVAISKSTFTGISPLAAAWSAIVYAAFQSTGVIGGVVTVADGLRDRRDSKKAVICGILMNAIFLVIIAIMLMGHPDEIGKDLPNYYVAKGTGFPALIFTYVVLVFFACVTNTISFSHALSGHYSKFLPIKSEALNKSIICLVMLVYISAMSFLGLATIVKVGFAYLGYVAIPTLMLPVLIVAPRRIRQLSQN